MKKMQIKTGRQAERTAKELKQLRKLDRSIDKPAKNQTPQDNPQIVVISKNVNSTTRSKKLSGSFGQTKSRRRPKFSVKKPSNADDENQSVPVGFRVMVARLLHRLCEREPTLTLKTLQNFGFMLVFIVVIIFGSGLIIFHDKGMQVLELIVGNHQHSEASRVVVNTEKKS